MFSTTPRAKIDALKSKLEASKAAALHQKEKLARIVEMLKPPSKTSQKSFAWDCVVSDDSKKEDRK